MSLELLTLAMFVTLILSIALGHQLAFTLAGVATLFGLIDNGFNIPGLFDLYANNVWGLMNNYTERPWNFWLLGKIKRILCVMQSALF